MVNRAKHKKFQRQEAKTRLSKSKPKETLIEFFKQAPHPEIKLDLQRDRDLGREIDL